ncbi:hypothetical protein M9458_005604, partial [Cirrhinus mrigala]
SSEGTISMQEGEVLATDGRECAETMGTRATSQLLMLQSRLINDLIPFSPAAAEMHYTKHY